tara:strand:- start:624 stop:1364 length:741 start_codon:yes stop_codon:yes gene_type:complete
MKKYEDCCVIIRGLFNEELHRDIENLKKVYDGEIIYSAWNGADLPALEGIKIVLQDDPGTGPIQNIKRAMYPVSAALKETDKNKIFVIRSDVRFEKVPFSFYDDSKVYFSSIMSLPVVMGLPLKEALSTRFNYNNFCRFGDLFHLGSREEIGRLFSYFTEYEVARYLQTLPQCTEQWMFHKYITSKLGPELKFPGSGYDRYIAENVGILDLADLDAKFNINGEKKYDDAYFNKEWHARFKSVVEDD